MTTTTTLLYHKEIGFPNDIQLPGGILELNYSKHAKMAAMTDRYGHVKLPREINISKCDLIEIETKHNKLQKCVYRTSYDNKYDITIVIIPKRNYVKTIWLNSKYDNHKTLKVEKYAKP